MKKILLLLLMMLPMVASAYDFEVDGIYYDIVSTTDLTVSVTNSGLNIGSYGNPSGKDYSGNFTIPESVMFAGKTMTVVKISTYAFYESNIETIVLPQTLKTISGSAFEASKQLKEITIPSSVEVVGSFAFGGCSSLKKAIIEDSDIPLGIDVSNSYAGIFRLCPLEELYLGRNIQRRSNGYDNQLSPFGLHQLQSNQLTIEIGGTVTSLCDCMFSSAKKLTCITIPENVESIGEYAFSDCSSLTDITLPSQLTKLSQYTFYKCEKLESIVLPNSINTLDNGAFYGCSSLEEIVLPQSLIKIGQQAFDQCSKLTNINSLPYTPPTAFDNSFSTVVYWTSTLTIPYGTKEKYSMMDGWKNFSIINEDMSNVAKYHLYYMVDGEEYKSFEIEYGATITPEAEPSKEGYVFSGWSDIPATMPAHDVTVTGTFTPAGHEYVDLGLPSGRLWAKTNLGASTESEYGEYMDWRSRAAIQETWGEEWSTPSSSDMAELYNYCTFTWETLNSVYGCRVTGRNGNSIFLPAAGYKLDGYNVMVGQGIYYWDNNEYESGMAGILSGSATNGVSINATMNYNYATMPIRPVTNLSGVAKYQLTYWVDNEVYKNYEIEEGATIIPETYPTKEGYTFSGWTGLPATMPAHDVTVTGTFSINIYKLTYKVDGVVYKTLDVEYGATITPEPAPTKEGYTFSGWSEIPATMPAHDVTVTGTFTQETGIDQIKGSENGKAMIFTIDGKRVDTPKKGVNVIRMKDGTMRKVVVK